MGQEECRAADRSDRRGALSRSAAGRDDRLFSDDAATSIHQSSRGYPRAVNNLALQALIAAFADGKGMVDESATRAAINEVMSE